jgi:hypothetical protein
MGHHRAVAKAIVRDLLVAIVAFAALPLAAKPIGYVSTSTVTIVIHDDRGDCPEGLKQATWVQPNGAVTGCYWERNGVLFFGWDDMDVHAIPERLFRRPGS